MVTHDPDIARQAIAVSNSPTALALRYVAARPGHPLACRWSTLPIVAATSLPTTRSVSITCSSKSGFAARKESQRW